MRYLGFALVVGANVLWQRERSSTSAYESLFGRLTLGALMFIAGFILIMVDLTQTRP